MKLFPTVVVLGLVLGAHAGFECEAPIAAGGPLPPVLPANFHMIYEKTDLLNEKTTFHEVWYDWMNQKARVDEVVDGEKTVRLFDFADAAGFKYKVIDPGTENTADQRSGLCQFFPINVESPERLYFYNPSEKPLRMVDVYHALLFGGPFRYAYSADVANMTSRHIQARKFESCVKDETGRLLKIAYYWTIEDPEIEGEMPENNNFLEKPIKCEREGEDLKELLSIVRFHRNPKFSAGTFDVPRHVDCAGFPYVTPVKELPSMSDDFAWREETITYLENDDGTVFGNLRESYREIWVADQYKMARLDWTPTQSEVDNTFLDGYADEPVSVVADMRYGGVFITNKDTGRCVVKPLTEDFPLSKKVNGKFVLKTAAELVGLDGPRVMKGRYLERGNDVTVYITNITNDPNAEGTTFHETTLRFDMDQFLESEKYYEFMPVSQLTRRIAPDLENTSPAKIKYEQTNYFRYRSEHRPMHVFSAPGCIVHHRRRHFEMRFASSAWDVIGKRKNFFVDKLRHQIYLRGDFETVMRVQDVDVSLKPEFDGIEQLIENGDVIARMTFLETLDEIMSRKTVSIDEAAAKIREAVDGGFMAIPFEFKDGDEDMEVLKALEYTFKEVNTDGSTVLSRSVREVVEKGVADIGPGYSIGAFVGICFGALFLGVGLGVLIAYLKSKSAESNTPDEVPLGDIERNQREVDLNRPGPSGWKPLNQTQLETLDE